MSGDDRCRFCSQCELHVFDLSAMERPEAEQFVRERLEVDDGERLCVRFSRRADGTVLTRDCPVGWKQRARRARARVVAACAGLLALVGCRKTLPVQGEARPPEAPVHQPDGDGVEALEIMGEMEAPGAAHRPIQGRVMPMPRPPEGPSTQKELR